MTSESATGKRPLNMGSQERQVKGCFQIYFGADFCAPTAQSIPAWGIAPDGVFQMGTRAEGPIYF